MIDVDVISHFDVCIGLPVVDTRTMATRWLGCLHHGPTFHGRPNVVPHFYNTFDAVSVEHKTKPTPPVTDPRENLIKCKIKQKLNIK